ncbi:MAG TPA: acetate uptake transporter [Nocardioidaceae bacterium]|nr:acetate uptake transporter [Nocardioidaceae bacterium]
MSESPTTTGAHLADPAPLGLGAFALTTFVLSVVNAEIIPLEAEPVVFGLALAYGGIAQFGAGMWEFAKGNTFGATAFCSYGGFWVSFWYLTGHTDLSSAGNAVNDGIGLYLIAWAIFTLYMTVAATRVNVAVLAVFVLLTITYVLLAIGEFTETSGWTNSGGWVGILTAIAAWYASFAGVTNFTYGRAMVPVVPLGR